MTDQALRRTDELLTELVELVETARTVPMSSSIVLPRERVLDLLDELRETMPPEMQEARRTIASRDTMLHDAYEQATRARETAAAEAEALLTDARQRADLALHEADVHAHEIIEAGRAEHAHLVSATGVHQAAAQAAEELRAEAQHSAEELRAEAQHRAEELNAEADRRADRRRSDAEAYAAKLSADAEDYADRTLAELAETLQRSAATAVQGRSALARRRATGADRFQAALTAEPTAEASSQPVVGADGPDAGAPGDGGPPAEAANSD